MSNPFKEGDKVKLIYKSMRSQVKNYSVGQVSFVEDIYCYVLFNIGSDESIVWSNQTARNGKLYSGCWIYTDIELAEPVRYKII